VRERWLLALLALVVVAPLWEVATLQGTVITDDGFASDIMNNGFPERYSAARSLSRLEAPLWMTEIYAGFPLVARAESGALAPLNLALYGLLPPYVALNLSIVATWLLAAFGTYAFSRAIGADRPGAAVASVAFAWSGFLVCHMKHLSMVNTAAWLPVGLWALERAMRSGRPQAFLLVGFVVAMQDLSGHIQVSFYSGLVYLSYFAAHLERQGLRQLPWLLAALALGHAGGAVQLLPTWELVGLSDRSGGMGFASAAQYAYDPINWKTFFYPYANGDVGSFTYTGEGVFWESYGYVGALTLALALYAVVSGWRERVIRYLGGAVVVAYLLVLGPRTPFFELALYLPGMSFFRFPTRFLLVVDLGLCALAALGITHLLRRVSERVSARSANGVALGIATLVVADLYTFQPRQNAIVDLELWERPPALAQRLREDPERFRIFSPLAAATHIEAFRQANGWQGDLTPFVRQREFLQPSINVLYGLASADGYAQLTPRYVVDVWGDQQRLGLVQTSHQASEGVLETRPPFDRLMSLYNVKYVLSPYAMETPRRFELLGHFSGVHLYRNPDVLPRAFVVGRVRIVGGAAEALSALGARNFDPSEEVILFDHPGVPLGRGHESSTADLVDYGTNRVVVQVEAASDGLLVLSDTWYPGWKATIDGRPTKVLRANHALRAVAVPAGSHEVRFEFRSRSIALGAVVSLVAFAGMGAAALWRRKPT
jgi:hypothetical protein